MAALEPKPILISGAGPTGLVLALWLHKFNVPFRIVDKSPRVESTSRALVVHARTLEFYRQLGIADEIIAAGFAAQQFNFNHNRKYRGHVPTGKVGKDLSNFPIVLCLAQDRHEIVLEDALNRRGHKVERGVEVLGFTEDDATDGVQVRLRVTDAAGKQNEELYAASFLAGCDGAHSAVRAACGIHMEGGTYQRRFFVADVDVSGGIVSDDKLNMCLSDEDFSVVIPLNRKNHARIVGVVPAELGEDGVPTFDDVRPSIARNCDLTIEGVNWFSHYKVHHRRASAFRKGRAFLLGDASHLHSPVGGQGMNTGIGDATNLAWKLATVHHAKSKSSESPSSSFLSFTDLLQSYDTERLRFAQKLVDTTDYAFTLISGSTWGSHLVRNYVLPYVMPFMLRNFNVVAPTMFRKTSQIEIEYSYSELSAPPVGKLGGTAKAGDRLPWVPSITRKDETGGSGTEGVEEDNYAVLESSRWQGHVYGEVPKSVQDAFKAQGLPLHVFAWNALAKKAGLSKDATYLIRPDGHIGLAFAPNSYGTEKLQQSLDDYCKKWGANVQATQNAA